PNAATAGAAAGGRVVAEGTVGQGRRALVLHAAALQGRIVAEGAGGHRGRALVQEAAVGVVVEGAVGQCGPAFGNNTDAAALQDGIVAVRAVAEAGLAGPIRADSAAAVAR